MVPDAARSIDAARGPRLRAGTATGGRCVRRTSLAPSLARDAGHPSDATGPIIIAVLLLVVLALRRRTLTRVTAIGGLIVAGGLVAFGLGAFTLPSVDDALTRLAPALGNWTYPLVGLLAYLEAAAFVGLLVPGELTVGARRRHRALRATSRSSRSSSWSGSRRAPAMPRGTSSGASSGATS